MHVRAKKMAISGMLLAITVICMILGGIIETNTLFLLAAAAFFVGIIQNEFGIKYGWAFWLAAVLLGGMLVGNKFYVLSYAAMSLYILLIESVWRYLAKHSENKYRKQCFWTAKYVIFNAMYIPIVIGFQELLFTENLSQIMLLTVIIIGQIGLLIYDRAYEHVQADIWRKMRGRLLGN